MNLKMFRKFICMVLSAAVLLAAVPLAFAEGETSGTDYNNENITWSYDADSATLTLSGTGNIHDYKAGSSNADYYKNRPWEAYAATAAKIVIGDGITRIGNQAFRDFKAAVTAELPATLTEIGQTSFYTVGQGQSFMIRIPASVNKIEANAFYQATNSKNEWIIFEERTQDITLSPTAFRNDGKTKTWLCAENPTENLMTGLNTFGNDRIITYNYDADTKILTMSSTSGDFGEWNSGANTTDYFMRTLRPWNDYVSKASGIVFEEGVTNLSKNSFFGCINAQNIKLPSTLTEIGEAALYQNQAKYLNIPSTVTKIGKNGLFSATKFNNKENSDFVLVISSPEITVDNAMLNSNVTSTIYYLPGVENVDTLISNNGNLTGAELKNGITALADNKAIVYNGSENNAANSAIVYAAYADAQRNGLSDVKAVTGYSLSAKNADIVTAPADFDTASAQAKRIFWLDSLTSLTPLCEAVNY